jgi:hypothetical protein
MDEDSIYAKKDFTGAQMMMVIKLTSTAFSIQDGRRDEKVTFECFSCKI